jgi:hypothetical protein
LFGALLLLTMRFARNGLLALAWQQVRALGRPRAAPDVFTEQSRSAPR